MTGFTVTKLGTCEAGTSTEDPVDFVTSGKTQLRDDGAAGQFIQNWQTPKVNSEQCYRVSVNFQDGTAIYAFFKLKK